MTSFKRLGTLKEIFFYEKAVMFPEKLSNLERVYLLFISRGLCSSMDFKYQTRLVPMNVFPMNILFLDRSIKDN